MEIVKAKLDIVFKALFTKNRDVLKCFVADILDIPKNDITELIVDNPEIYPDAKDGKESQLDLKLRVDDKIVNVEIQLCNKVNYKDRVVYYWAKMFTDDLKKSEDYLLLKRTICISIVDFDLFKECKSPYSKFLILEENRHVLLTDKFAILFLELPKIDSNVNKNDRKKLWLQFLKAETEEELDMLNKTGVPEIKTAVNFLHRMSADEKLREAARMREKTIRDEISAINFAKLEGRQEGRQEGREEGREEGIQEGIQVGREKGREEQKNELITKWRNKGYTEEQIQDLLN